MTLSVPPPAAPPLSRQTARLLLRPICAGDAGMYTGWLAGNRDHLAPWSPRTPPGATPEDLFRRSMLRQERGEAARFLGLDGDGRLIGVFNLNEIVRGPFQNAYAGWSVGASAEGQGYATEGVRALLSLAFGELGLQRVQANILPRNHRSLRLAERVGMRREGLALRYLEIDGVREDHVMYARLAQEPERC